jgi:SLA1 homology domain 1, SHD1
VRQWVDDTGTFRVKGRLILILDGKVRVLKETGRTTTVPLTRLSAADRQYVEDVISRYGSDLTQLGQLAAR